MIILGVILFNRPISSKPIQTIPPTIAPAVHATYTPIFAPTDILVIHPTLTDVPVSNPVPTLSPILANKATWIPTKQTATDINFYSSPQYVKIGQPITLVFGWYAKTRQQVEDHMATVSYEIYVDDVRVYVDQQMSKIEYVNDDKNSGKFYMVNMYAPVGNLSPGKHIAKAHQTWSRLISDGWDSYGPGGDFEYDNHFCVIIVQ